MLSTIESELVVKDGIARLQSKELPNYCGIEDVGFVWHNEWADPELEYQGQRTNLHDVEDIMWERYTTESPEPNYYEPNGEIISREWQRYADKFVDYVKEHVNEVYELLRGDDYE